MVKNWTILNRTELNDLTKKLIKLTINWATLSQTEQISAKTEQNYFLQTLAKSGAGLCQKCIRPWKFLKHLTYGCHLRLLRNFWLFYTTMDLFNPCMDKLAPAIVKENSHNWYSTGNWKWSKCFKKFDLNIWVSPIGI